MNLWKTCHALSRNHCELSRRLIQVRRADAKLLTVGCGIGFMAELSSVTGLNVPSFKCRAALLNVDYQVRRPRLSTRCRYIQVLR